ncbi:sigma 54-interacting transcriptional regulator [Paragemmobacter straminiformis]|uniref:Nif-specific regulatory protein n=1 Tax=Paragemmobacter straminiformis TaxID=2045119 RepID=A0A842I5T8_9RHOB|nr:sigma-54 dependent transcriptional regulator [Gemmobacter straminiformis]MBC2834783.1 sigma-54-dependent Fis family transcriptional regulator [Gemmobacter straminiformis]
MTMIHLIDDNFEAACALAQLLGRRRVAVERGAKPVKAAQVLVASAVEEQRLGGPRGLTDLARGCGAKCVIVVTEGAAAFGLLSEMGGRMLRVALPKTATVALRDSGLLMLADIIGGQVQAMVAADPATGQLIDLAARVARTDVTVFINGPTGSGKEVLARQVHAASRRANAPFVAINCAAIPENMLEAILFGHEKGAFTGASTANKGIIRAAEGGTLMLDEVSEMPMGLQSKLLRVLQERSLTPIGSQTEVAVDIRIIATSNRDMPEEVRARRFREDLFYRLNVFPLATRALCERPDDIPVLAAAMVRRHTPEGTALPMLSAEAIATLMAHDWPGNVRELENVIQRALVMQDGGVIEAADLLINASAPSAMLALARAV